MAVIRKWSLMIACSVLVGATITLGAGLATAGAASAACYPPGSTTCTGTLTSSSPAVAPGGTETITGTGYAPGANVTVNVCNIETLHVTASSTGTFSLPITIPTSAPAGTCTVTASGKGASGSILTQTTSFIITSASTIPGTHTGEPWSGWVYWLLAGAMGLFGFGLVEVGRRRRAHST